MPKSEQQVSGGWLKIALLSGLLFGLPMGVFYTWQSGRPAVGIATGLAAGLLFGSLFTFLIRRFAERQSSRFEATRPEFGDERIWMEGPANHFKGAEGVGGYLWLTDRRVHFMSHAFNIQNHEWLCLLPEIKDVQAVKTLGLFDNGLRITTDAGEIHRLVVNNSRQWAESIRQEAGLRD